METSTTATHVFADGLMNRTISATGTDEDGTYAAGNTPVVQVTNVAPALVLSGAVAAVEGSVYTLTLSSSDPGDDTLSSWAVTWGDGSAVQTVPAGTRAFNSSTGRWETSTTATHVFADGLMNRTISATGTGEDGTFAAGNTQVVQVTNVAPALVLSGAAAVAEGSVYTLTLSSNDPGEDTLSSWAVNWGDGSGLQTVTAIGRVFNSSTGRWETSTTATHVFADGLMNRTISATGTDEDGTYAAGNTQVVQVTNVAPALVLSGAAAVAEGSVYMLTLSASDPGDDTLSSWAVTWGDGSAVQTVPAGTRAFNSSTGRWETSTTATHVFADGLMNRTISAMGTDEDGTYAAGNTQVVQVTNVAPALVLSGAAAVAEGSVYTLTLSASDPGDDTLSSWAVTWGDGSAVQTVPAGTRAFNSSTGRWETSTTATHVFADGLMNRTISAAGTDEDGTYAAGNTQLLQVTNVAPALVLSGAAAVAEGSLYTLTLFSSDPGDDTLSSWAVTWGDGSAVQTVPAGTRAFNSSTGRWETSTTATHVFADGLMNRTISATGTDEDGTFAAGNTQVVQVTNVAPVVAANNAALTVGEGLQVTNTGTWSDVAADQPNVTLSASVGTVVKQANGTWSWSYTPPDGATVQTVTITADDHEAANHQRSTSFTLTVDNVAPALTLQASSVTIDEGQTATNQGLWSDVAADNVTFTASLGTVTRTATGPGIGPIRRPTIRPRRR